MNEICLLKTRSLLRMAILFINLILPLGALAQDQGVIIDRPGIVQQEITPFVPLNEILVLDPNQEAIILLFPRVEPQKELQPEHTREETESRVIKNTRA